MAAVSLHGLVAASVAVDARFSSEPSSSFEPPRNSLSLAQVVSRTRGQFIGSQSLSHTPLRQNEAKRAQQQDAVRSSTIVAVLDIPRDPEAQEKQVFSTVADLSPRGRIENFDSNERRIFEVVVKQAADADIQARSDAGAAKRKLVIDSKLLDEAYARCGEVCAEYAKTFYLGTKLMTPERQRAIWAIYVWCRRTDELVDGPNALHITPQALDRWEERLEDVFYGQPYDMLDAALADTVATFPVQIQPFRDMIEGMRMDLRKDRYDNFDDLYLYCYNVAGTVGLMSVPVMGIAPESKSSPDTVYSAALALGIANQLTNILRDVGEDARRGRVYLPQDELAKFGLSDADIFEGVVTDKWRDFMRFQIKRARSYFESAEEGVRELDRHSRWPVWASLSLYSQILDAIEANDYDNFTKRAYVRKWKKLLSLPGSYVKAQVLQPVSTSAKIDAPIQPSFSE